MSGHIFPSRERRKCPLLWAEDPYPELESKAWTSNEIRLQKTYWKPTGCDRLESIVFRTAPGDDYIEQDVFLCRADP